MSLTLQEQLLTLTEPFRDSHVLTQEHKTDLEQRVKTFIDEMLTNPEIAPADKNKTLSLLHRCTPNTTIKSLRGLLTLNLVNPLSPSAAICTPYKEMQIPFITSYHSSPRYALTARLRPIDCESVIPQAVRNAIGRDLPIENVDLFLTTELPPLMGYEDVSGEYFHKNYDQASTELLVKFHPWLYRDLPVGSDVTTKLSMGVFPGFGISKGQHDPISINTMSEKSVHAHPADDDAKYMLYSPNNSHLAIDPEAPFCSTWIVARHRERACAAKVLLPTPSTEAKYFVFQELLELHKGCSTAGEYIDRLEAFRPRVSDFLEHVFNPIIEAANRGDLEAIQQMLDQIPKSFQDKIFNECNKLSPSENPKERFYSAEKQFQLECIRNASESITHDAVGESINLLTATRATQIAAPARREPLHIAILMNRNVSSKDTFHIKGNGPGMHNWSAPFITFKAGLSALIEVDLPYSENPYAFKIQKIKANGDDVWQSMPFGKKNLITSDQKVQDGFIIAEFDR